MKVKSLLTLTFLTTGTLSFGQNKIPYSVKIDNFIMEKRSYPLYKNTPEKDPFYQMNEKYLQRDVDIKPLEREMPILIPKSKHSMPMGNIPEDLEFKMPVLDIKELK